MTATKQKEIPPPEPCSAVGTCDWGHCDEESVMLRWSPSYGGWLSVCDSHLLSGGGGKNKRILPLDADPLWNPADKQTA